VTTIKTKSVGDMLGTFGLQFGSLPAGVERYTVVIDAAAATRLLNANEGNRRLNQTLAFSYARMMEEPGGWPYVGDPIRVDKTGRLLDGQHRLRAVELCGVPLTVDIILGLEPETQDNMDVNATRKASHQVAMAGVKHAVAAAPAARLLMRWGFHDDPERETWTLASDTFAPARPEITQWVRRHKDAIERSSGLAFAAFNAMGIKPSVAAALHFRASRISLAYADEFLYSLRTGEDMSAGNPILTLRNKIIRQKRDSIREEQDPQLYHAVTAWNWWIARKPTYKLQSPRNEPIRAGSEIKLSTKILLVDGEKWAPKEKDEK
jgi:hypothetical protein